MRRNRWRFPPASSASPPSKASPNTGCPTACACSFFPIPPAQSSPSISRTKSARGMRTMAKRAWRTCWSISSSRARRGIRISRRSSPSTARAPMVPPGSIARTTTKPLPPPRKTSAGRSISKRTAWSIRTSRAPTSRRSSAWSATNSSAAKTAPPACSTSACCPPFSSGTITAIPPSAKNPTSRAPRSSASRLSTASTISRTTRCWSSPAASTSSARSS